MNSSSFGNVSTKLVNESKHNQTQPNHIFDIYVYRGFGIK